MEKKNHLFLPQERTLETLRENIFLKLKSEFFILPLQAQKVDYV